MSGARGLGARVGASRGEEEDKTKKQRKKERERGREREREVAILMCLARINFLDYHGQSRPLSGPTLTLSSSAVTLVPWHRTESCSSALAGRFRTHTRTS